jgi:benzoate membrane transport protein
LSRTFLSLAKDVSFAALAAGFVAVLVGFTSSAALVFQAALAFGATPAEVGSWILALGLGMAATSITLSLRYRVPVVTAWSTPGAAMLITAAAGVSMQEAIGAFIVCGLLITLAGYSGLFERLFARIPLSIAAAMLAGVLLRFGIDVFNALNAQFTLAGAMLAGYLVMRRLQPRYAVIVALLAGIVVAAFQGTLHLDSVQLEIAQPRFVQPEWSVASLIGIALPLFIVTMASQNVPGVATLRASGYAPPISPIIGATGIATLLLAPFGAFALNLAAITAAICMGREAHEDPARRYVAAIAAGAFYLLLGVFGATVGALFAAFPRELVLAIAGIALFGTIGGALAQALADEREREPALITFLVTASGLTLGGVGSAFWGLVAGAITHVVLRWRRVGP